MVMESGGFKTQFDAMLDAQLSALGEDANFYVHETDEDATGKVFFEVPRELADAVVKRAGGDPESFCEALRSLV